MTTKAAKKQVPPELPEAFYRISSLLHTMRCIAQHEDRLCLLRNEIRRTQAVGPRLSKELKALLDELPAEEYAGDLHAVEAALASHAPAATKATRPSNKAAGAVAKKAASKSGKQQA